MKTVLRSKKRVMASLAGFRDRAAADAREYPPFWSTRIGTAEVAALQTAHKNTLTCTAIAEGGCFGTHSALAVLRQPQGMPGL